MFKKLLWLGVALCLIAVLAACSDKDGALDPEEPGVEIPMDPAEIVFFYPYPSDYSEESFMERFGRPIQQKYPHFDVKLILGAAGTTIPELITSRTNFDIIFTSIGATNEFLTDPELQYDITPLIQKYQYDLDRLDPGALDIARILANNKGIYGLPVSGSASALYYNKDIFDLFGVDYPQDNSTWDDIYEMSRRLTRSDGDKKYYGFGTMFDHIMMLNQRSLPIVETSSLKAAIERDAWRPLIENFVRFYTLPGYDWERNHFSVTQQRNRFFVNREVAMWYTPTSLYNQTHFTDMNWDLTSTPTYADLPGVGSQAYPTYFYITSISENKDAAFLAIAHLTSDEYQLEQTRTGLIIPVLRNEEIRAAFGQEGSVYEGKNIQALFPDRHAPMNDINKYHFAFRSMMNSDVLTPIILGEKDMNTALREAAEKMNLRIEQTEAAAR